jgi:hypothetical protein
MTTTDRDDCIPDPSHLFMKKSRRHTGCNDMIKGR